mmetsp:Transcript_84007/g.270642  ORF Transcript_84007/g.270642 Transcript_84007/m.270642 type:complete len:203 (+) Transcript_84007:437-1045(+)
MVTIMIGYIMAVSATKQKGRGIRRRTAISDNRPENNLPKLCAQENIAVASAASVFPPPRLSVMLPMFVVSRMPPLCSEKMTNHSSHESARFSIFPGPLAHGDGGLDAASRGLLETAPAPPTAPPLGRPAANTTCASAPSSAPPAPSPRRRPPPGRRRSPGSATMTKIALLSTVLSVLFTLSCSSDARAVVAISTKVFAVNRW